MHSRESTLGILGAGILVGDAAWVTSVPHWQP